MIRLRQYQLWHHAIPLARPFRFGITELTSLDHGVLDAEFEIAGRSVRGFAGENLVPRWFVKDPALSMEDERTLLRRAVHAMARRATELPAEPTPFDLWWTLHRDARQSGLVRPPLLSQLAESLVERAAIDAWCRSQGITLADAIARDALGFEPGRIEPTLGDPASRGWRSTPPATRLAVRHTVGLSDSLDELPGVLRATGITGLKIKLGGDVRVDLDRLRAIAAAIERGPLAIHRITLDGNENYASPEAFASLLRSLRSDAALRAVAAPLAWIEQPFRRDLALSDDLRGVLSDPGGWPMVIDESDASPADLPRALALGYAGTTHKNCKGVFKSLLHALTLRHHAETTGRTTVFSGEDLTIVAPWSQAADLVVAAAAGVVDIERNGQHFADGLIGFDSGVGEQAVRAYPQTYRRRAGGGVELRIDDGLLAVPAGPIEPPLLAGFERLTP